ncbi:hypothetical protein JOE63_003027 [Cellulosimicrobium cellulans]|uniref:DUF3515 family protein n=1 Tax=Cellulosimicrobium cellulans TaxID=1710 RepID=UPI0027DD7CFD|nr:DUF3515 family protein [Cellulosimicrobium cellulans]MBM7820550.1 hypothetical protein [Cellulosimicrobium cellulans]
MLDAVPPASPSTRPGPSRPRRSRPLTRTVAVPALLGVVAATAACAPSIGVPVADDAQNPLCADVVLALPETLGEDLAKVGTTSQATAAWGEPGAAVTLRCGVEVPGPTTTTCQSVESDGGTVDWLVVEDEGTWTFTTYGRDPAVQVVVPPAVTEDHSTSFIADLGRAVMEVPQTRACVGTGDVG